MKVAVGIASLFLTVVAGIHSVLIFYGSFLVSIEYAKYGGYALAITALLFLFGGSFAFKEPHMSAKLFGTAMFVTAIAGLLFNWHLFVWCGVAILLYSLSNKASEAVA